jgi:hypothetical protein
MYKLRHSLVVVGCPACISAPSAAGATLHTLRLHLLCYIMLRCPPVPTTTLGVSRMLNAAGSVGSLHSGYVMFCDVMLFQLCYVRYHN